MKDGAHPPTPRCPRPSSPPTVQRARSLGRPLPPPVDWTWTPVRAQGRIAMLGLCQRDPASVRLVPAGAPGTAPSERDLGLQDHFPNPSSPLPADPS